MDFRFLQTQRIALFLLLLQLPAPAALNDLFKIDFGERTWTSADGRELQAQLVAADETEAQLKLAATGKTVPVPQESLSEKDREYIAAWIEAKKIIWGFEVLAAEYPSSYRTEPRNGDTSTRQTIKPMMGKPDDILLLLTLKVTPPPNVAASYFDAAGMVFKVSTEAGLVAASPKYIVPPDPKKVNDDGSVERNILYQVPRGAKPAEITYRDNPPVAL